MAELYPEHEKMRFVREESQTIGEFLEWLRDKGWYIAQEEGQRAWPVTTPIDVLLAEYFEIDLKKIDQEKQQMLNEFQRLREEDVES